MTWDEAQAQSLRVVRRARRRPWGVSSRPFTSCATFTRKTSGRRVQLQLNRGESRHALARWLFFANRGEFRSGDYEEIMNKASCLSLLSNAVLVWNTMAIMKIITELRAAGETIVDEDLTRISPLMYQHVIPNGTYHFARSKPGDDIA